jgi:hypothetical protein
MGGVVPPISVSNEVLLTQYEVCSAYEVRRAYEVLLRNMIL